MGYDNLAGELDGGITAWQAAGHIPGATHCELGALASPGRAAGLRERPVTVMCEHGERGMTGASLLAAAGSADLCVLRGGPGDWAKAAGEPLEHR